MVDVTMEIGNKKSQKRRGRRKFPKGSGENIIDDVAKGLCQKNRH